MPHRYLVKYTRQKFAGSIQVGTLWYYRDLVGNHSDYQDGLLTYKNGRPAVPRRNVDYQAYLDIANCYVVCLTVQDDLTPNPILVERFDADVVLPIGLIGDPLVPNVAYPVMRGANGEIPFYANPERDPNVDRTEEVFSQIKMPLVELFSQEIYAQMERSNRVPVRDFHKEKRYEIRYWGNHVTYLPPETHLSFPSEDPEQVANAILFAKEASFTIEREYRFAFRLFDKTLNRFVSVNYKPITLPLGVIQSPSIKFYV